MKFLLSSKTNFSWLKFVTTDRDNVKNKTAVAWLSCFHSSLQAAISPRTCEQMFETSPLSEKLFKTCLHKASIVLLKSFVQWIL